MGKSKQKKKVILPPELPPDVPEDEIEVSDEDLEYVIENPDYAGLVSKLDTPSINRHVIRAADVKEDALESLYERRQKNKSQVKEKEDVGIEVDPVDALPVKTLDGKLYYRTASKVPKESATAENEDEATGENEGDAEDKGVLKLTKAERRAKLKKLKKETKKQKKEGMEVEEVQQTPQDAVLAEVQKDLTVEEASEQMKFRLAELGTALLMDPEANIKTLKEMLQITKDGDHAIVVLGMKSLLAVFKDIIPGYRIRLPTEKEQEMVVSKAVKKMRFYESTLLSSYKAYLQKLIALERQASFQRVAARCICTLLESVPHFNFRESLLAAVMKNISSSDDVVRKYCCGAIKSLFTNEGKHSGEATVEAVQLIANLVKTRDCQLLPDSIEVFLFLSFDEDLGRPENSKVDKKVKSKKHFKIFKKGKRGAEPNQLPDERKKSKQELMSKTRDEVNADFKAASFTLDVEERKRMQSDILSYVFQTYFRILKHTMQSRSEPTSAVMAGAFGGHPLLAPCLSGLGKFAHLIDMDYMADLMKSLRILAGGRDAADKSLGNGSNHLTVSERLRCCIVAFKVMKKNLDALNVDLQDFFVQLYNLIYEYSTGRDDGEVLAEALKVMLCDDRQHDMQRAAAFIKRLATFSLCSGSAESMAALVTLKHLLQKNAKCRNLLENDAGGGSLSGSIAKYQPYASDPHLSGALASVLWELNLLSKHYHPTVATMASTILTLSTEHTQIYHANVSPQQAFMEMSVEKESFNLKSVPNSKNKRKRGNGPPAANVKVNLDIPSPADENEVRNKLSEHFLLVRDMTENEKLRAELEQTKLSLELYEEYKKQKKKKKKNQ